MPRAFLAGLAGQPCPGGQQQGWGPWGTFLLHFQKGNILFLYVFINSSACAPWHFYIPLPISTLGLHPPNVSHFTPLSSSCTHFLQHLLLTPTCALPCPLPPAAAPAGAVHVQTMLGMPVLPPWRGGLGMPSVGVWLAGPNRGAGHWTGTAPEAEGMEGVLVALLPEGAGVAGAAVLRGVLARNCELQGWSAQKCLCRGQGLSFPPPPPRSRPAVLGPKPIPSHSGRGAGTPCAGLDPGPMVGGRSALSQAWPGTSGAFLIISAWVTRGFL